MSLNLSPELLRQLMDYDPNTGLLSWRLRDESLFNSSWNRSAKVCAKAWNDKFAGKPALINIGAEGYLQGRVFNKHVSAHRAAWAIQFGYWPSGQIDHIDGNKLNNSLKNFRHVDAEENAKNRAISTANTSGRTGLSWIASRGRWYFCAQAGGRKIQGRDACFGRALLSRMEAEKLLQFHRNHGRKV